MFGYVIPDKPNMLVKDLSEYRAYYCGLCKAIGKSYSEKARLLTNYDCTFLAAFLHNLYVEMPKFNDEVCILNPVKKKTVCVSEKSGLIIITTTVYVSCKRKRFVSKSNLQAKSNFLSYCT